MDESQSDMQRYDEQRRKPLAHRKSPWNLLIFAICIIFTGASWIASIKLGTAIHLIMYSGQYLSNSQGLGTILMAVSPFILMLPVGMIVGNWMVQLIAFAKRTLDAEAIEGDPHSTYRGAQHDLAMIAKMILPIAGMLYVLGICLPWHAN